MKPALHSLVPSETCHENRRAMARLAFRSSDVIDWMEANGLLDSALVYGDSVTNDYLPE